MTLHLHGIGHFHPEAEITNRFLEELDIETSDAWILERTGIRSRRTVMPLDYIRETHNRDPRAALEAAVYGNVDLAVRAAELALSRSGIAREAVGMVLSGSSAADTASPAEACTVAAALELEVPAFDVNSACTSLFAGLWVLSRMDPERLPDFVLITAPEGLTRTVCYDDRGAAVLWGDAAAAALISPRHPGRARLLGNTLGSSPAGADKVVVPRLGHFRQNGRSVQMFAIKRTIEELGKLRVAHGDPERTFHFVGHQANLRMLEAVCRQCEIPPERHHSNVEWFGNTGCASAASVLSMEWEKWSAEDDVGVVGVGSGLTWSSYLLRFEGAA